MRFTSRLTHVSKAFGLVCLGVFVMGADKGGCGASDIPTVTGDQCSAAADCEGLPHRTCLGAWACDVGACNWECSTAPVDCTDDSQCKTGQVCRTQSVCPACTTAVPPCASQCQMLGRCVVEEPLPKCITGGCSGELCVSEDSGGMASPCWYAEWFKCLGFSTCGNFGDNGACGWSKTAEFQQCMSGLSCDSDAACAPGYVCMNGVCQEVVTPPVGCFSDSECQQGQHCSISDGLCGQDPNCPMCDVCYGECVPDVVPTDCSQDADCGLGYVCEFTPDCPPCVYQVPSCKMACLIKGQCVPATVTSCYADTDCLDGQYCAMGECPSGTKCSDPSMKCLCAGTCQTKVEPNRCQGDADCPEGQKCYWTGGCPVCDCKADDPACVCAQCPVEAFGTCGPYCDSTQAEICGNGIDDNCNGQIDEGCFPPVSCLTDSECSPYEFCDYQGTIYDDAGNLMCCPANARCTAALPPCGGGVCRLQSGYCWVDTDCASGEQCVGAFRCPELSACYAADNPGKCTPVERIACQGDVDCPKGQTCVWSTGCPPCDCFAGDPSCMCIMCSPAANGWCSPASCVDQDFDGFCNDVDCDDLNSGVYPGAFDGCDGIDNDCDGQVDEDCKPACTRDADCSMYETCQMVLPVAGAGTACCPPTALCGPELPPCPGTGVCVLSSGLCWSDADCSYGQSCEGASVCPPGAMCLVADRPGKCVDAGVKCVGDKECVAGEFCDMTKNPISACCLPGQQCGNLPVCQGMCSLLEGYCRVDADCLAYQFCQVVLCDPTTGTLCAGPYQCQYYLD